MEWMLTDAEILKAVYQYAAKYPSEPNRRGIAKAQAKKLVEWLDENFYVLGDLEGILIEPIQWRELRRQVGL